MLKNKDKVALVTGCTGMDGSYLMEFLLSKGYKVYGLKRRSASENLWRIEHLLSDIELIDGDMTDQPSLSRALKMSNPDEVYNLAAQSFVGLSWDQPVLTAQVTGLGVLNLLEAIREYNPKIKLYQASSSEQYGAVREVPQTELTPFNSRSPYASAKIFAHNTVVNYRESYNMFCCCGILFNHEHSNRGLEFVTRKITNGVARIKTGQDTELRLGALDSKRDWGSAKDYVEAMWMMMQHDTPDDYVIATGEMHTVEEFCDIAFSRVGLDYKDYVVQDPRFMRPSDVKELCGDASKAKRILGWEPKTSFVELVNAMVDADLEREKSKLK